MPADLNGWSAHPATAPPDVAEPMLWRIAVRLLGDHDLVVRDRSGALLCELCRQPWPCAGRRIGQRGLLEARWRAR